MEGKQEHGGSQTGSAAGLWLTEVVIVETSTTTYLQRSTDEHLVEGFPAAQPGLKECRWRLTVTESKQNARGLLRTWPQTNSLATAEGQQVDLCRC